MRPSVCKERSVGWPGFSGFVNSVNKEFKLHKNCVINAAYQQVFGAS